MAQRWMEAKTTLAKRNGTVRSGCNRAMGGCWDDVITRRGQYDGVDRGCKPISKHGCGVKHWLPADKRPVAFGKGRKARRALMNAA
jgi:hypothetical protein